MSKIEHNIGRERTGRLVICADDFALTRGVSRAIADLAHTGKLNAISCMTQSPRWFEDSDLLADISDPVEIGLHLVLTDEPALGISSLPSANRLARMAWLGRVPTGQISASVARQFDRFQQVMKRPPAFVDGHQHCHFLAGIRQIVIAETVKRAPRAWIRTCEDRLSRILARPFRLKAIANSFGSAGLGSAARQAGLRCNTSFAGLYDFGDNFAESFPRFLSRGSPFHLVICHPGSGECPSDSIATARVREMAVLKQLPIAELATANDLQFAALST